MSDEQEQVARVDETVEQAFAQDATKAYEEAHDRSVQQEQRREAAKDAEPDLDQLLKEAQALELGILPVHDDLSPEEFARRRNAQERAGREGKIVAPPAPPEAQPRDENRRFRGDGDKQPHGEQFTPVIPPDHPHFQRQREALEYFGADRIAQITNEYQQAGVDLLPGLTREVAEFDNSPQVVLALMREPGVVQHLNEVATRSPAMASHMLKNIAKWVATGEVSSEEQAPAKISKPKPPEPVAARASSAFDLDNESMSPEEWARKRTAERRARGFSY